MDPLGIVSHDERSGAKEARLCHHEGTSSQSKISCRDGGRNRAVLPLWTPLSGQVPGRVRLPAF